MTDHQRDAALMERARTGDVGALEALYDLHAPLMLGVAMRILRDRSEAEDAVQEAWVQAWRQRESFDGTRGSVVAWLVTIARTRALDRYRSRASRLRLELQPVEPPGAAGGVERDSASGMLRERLQERMAELDPRHRQVIEIAYFEGLSQSEIAGRLDVPLGTVKHWTRQGLMALRAMMPRDAWT